MAFIKVVGMFDNREQLQRAKDELLRSGLARNATIRDEPEVLDEDLHPPKQSKGIWERLKSLFGDDSEELHAYAEGIRRGSWLLVVTTPVEKAEEIKEVMRRNGAIELRRRIMRWMKAGWDGFDLAGVAFTEEELAEERRCINEDVAEDKDDQQIRNIRLFDEATGREIGRISEQELAVLKATMEEEGPDDNDYWINPDEVDELACRPGATPHLIRVLRSAVGDNPDGMDIAYQREGEERQTLRATRAG